MFGQRYLVRDLHDEIRNLLDLNELKRASLFAMWEWLLQNQSP